MKDIMRRNEYFFYSINLLCYYHDNIFPVIIRVVNGYIIVRLIHFVFNIYMFIILTVESYIRDTDKPLHA